MRQETNNEMDLLLRRLGRRQDTSASDVDRGADGEHLDTDELSSYAENVLPVAAHARYTEHLADCRRCRELVVGLSSSLGFVAAEEAAKTPKPSGLRSFLASLFSPMVLRYSIPALGLLVVAVIGIGLWRRENITPTREAQSASERRSEPAAPVDQPQQSSPDTVARNLDKPAASDAKPFVQPSPVQQPSETAAKWASAPVTATADTVTANQQEPPAKKSAEQPTERVVAGLPTPAPSVMVDRVQSNVDAEARKVEAQGRAEAAKEGSRARTNEQAKDEDKRSDNAAAARSPARAKNESSGTKPASPGAVGSIAKLQRDGLDVQDKDDAEVRAIAGRRFRRQRGIWIDTGYDPSKNATSVTRGSEQYRALVADEPSIKIIAEQLDGEIIVVWKGRPYRIR